jgi:hypothetical protein
MESTNEVWIKYRTNFAEIVLNSKLAAFLWISIERLLNLLFADAASLASMQYLSMDELKHLGELKRHGSWIASGLHDC